MVGLDDRLCLEKSVVVVDGERRCRLEERLCRCESRRCRRDGNALQKTQPVVVRDDSLEDLSNRHFFVRTFELDRQEVFVSPFELDVENDRIEMLQDRVARQNGFRVTSHKMELYGLCADCQSAPPSSEGGPRA